MPSLLERFERHIEPLLPRGDRLLVGYSGGADSTCLLHMLSRLRYDIVAAHLHHGQRPEADKEMALCEALCTELDVPFLSGKADVPRMSEDLRIGLEEAGRQARYTFFQQGAFRTECTSIVTAHTQTDLVETVLMNLARGSGLSGLGGIPERRENIVRPLLLFTRQETRAYCDEHGLWTHDDPANSDLSFTRARIRHNVVPEMRQVNASFDTNVARLASVVREEDAFLDGMAAAALEQSEHPLNGELAFLTSDVEVAFRAASLLSLPAPLLKRALRLAVRAVGAQLDHHQTVVLVQNLAEQEKGSVTAEEGKVAVEWNQEVVHVRHLRPSVPFRYTLTLPGETISDEFGWQFLAFEASDREDPVRRSFEARLDPGLVKGQLYFRTAKEGDEMQPLGFDGHRKLSDLLAEAKLTAAARQRLPIVCDMLGPVWAPNVCLDGRCAASRTTDHAIVVRFEPVCR